MVALVLIVLRLNTIVARFVLVTNGHDKTIIKLWRDLIPHPLLWPSTTISIATNNHRQKCQLMAQSMRRRWPGRPCSSLSTCLRSWLRYLATIHRRTGAERIKYFYINSIKAENCGCRSQILIMWLFTRRDNKQIKPKADYSSLSSFEGGGTFIRPAIPPHVQQLIKAHSKLVGINSPRFRGQHPLSYAEDMQTMASWSGVPTNSTLIKYECECARETIIFSNSVRLWAIKMENQRFFPVLCEMTKLSGSFISSPDNYPFVSSSSQAPPWGDRRRRIPQIVSH